MPIELIEHYSRNFIRQNPECRFVFGDNMAGRGLGGTAKEARGEPNVIGIPTKWFPSLADEAFFSDDDSKLDEIYEAIDEAFENIDEALAEGRTVYWPSGGIGTYYASLPQKAPKIHAYIIAEFRRMKAKWG